MPDVTTAGDASSDTQAYVRFTRRVQAVLVDTIIFMIILAAALAVVVSFASDNIARIVGFAVAATWLFYEPLLVSLTGGTIGHYLYNMRVVDDRGGNVNFLKAVARVLINRCSAGTPFVTGPRSSDKFDGADQGSRQGPTPSFRGQARNDIATGHALACAAQCNYRRVSVVLFRAVLPRDGVPCSRRPGFQAVHRRRALFHGGVHCADAALGSLGGHQHLDGGCGMAKSASGGARRTIAVSRQPGVALACPLHVPLAIA
jgi:uncharacterized RDD family membrane protein YckC